MGACGGGWPLFFHVELRTRIFYCNDGRYSVYMDGGLVATRCLTPTIQIIICYLSIHGLNSPIESNFAECQNSHLSTHNKKCNLGISTGSKHQTHHLSVVHMMCNLGRIIVPVYQNSHWSDYHIGYSPIRSNSLGRQNNPSLAGHRDYKVTFHAYISGQRRTNQTQCKMAACMG